ncbi:MAG TPA: PQQ-dependent sugar dehydrogenase, partial [Planctomycetota bacterium]|nr:PQQ-dependent sugar dehydrogenase [Planctomycetota bacterium]
APLLWATGLRNPFRFHIDASDGALFVADVGESAFDEIDRISTAGQDLGWPWREGNAAFTGCTGSEPPSLAPIAVQPVPAQFQALISLGVYRAPATAPYWFGAAYDGDYFYTDHFTGRIWRLRRTANGWITAPPAPGQFSTALWASGVSWIADAKVGADGAWYFVERATSTVGSVRRIRPTNAAFAAFGHGCTGVVGPALAAAPGQLPLRGQTFSVQLTLLPQPPAGAAFGMLGLSKSLWGTTSLPLDLLGFGMPGCTGYVAPDATTLLVNSGGAATWPLAIPNLGGLIGQEIYLQALVLDPGRNAAGLTVSNAGEGVIR